MGCLLLLSCNNSSFQTTWTFDEDSALSAKGKEIALDLHTVRRSIELVPGIQGKALRTDGYSTWLTIDWNEKLASLSGWFALESFPTDTAAFMGVKDHLGVSVALCADRFGNLMLGLGKDSLYSYHALDKQIDRFRWLHLSLDLTNQSVCLNGEELQATAWNQPLAEGEKLVQVGKDFRDKKNWMYDVTAINGLIDEVTISQKACDVAMLKKDIARGLAQTPNLSVPEERFEKDFNRPHYHLLPAANWTNETHALFHYNGKYHLFNQKNASAIFLGQINWGHFSSPDLLHWTEEKPALTPDKEYDKNGIWSGHAVINDEGIPQLIYTAGGSKLGVGIAFPKDSTLVEWEKYEGNPVVEGSPKQFIRTDMRDQYVWKEGDIWYMIVGFGIEKTRIPHGALLLYKSTDLKKWTYVHLLFEGNPPVDKSGIFWEMPVFIKMENKYVLLVNRVPHKGVPARCQYWIGDFKGEKFIPDHPVPQNLEVINRLLSPSVLRTSDKDVVAIAIIPDEIGGRANYEQGWAHLYSMPRRWELKDGKLCQTPHPVMEQLREEKEVYPKQALNPGQPLSVGSGKHQAEIKAVFYPGNAKRFGFTLCKHEDDSEYSRIYYDVEKQELVVDQTKSSLREHIPLHVRKDTYPLDVTQPVEIHLFIDGSVVEGFINGEDAFTTRIFPLKEESTQVELFSDGTTTEVSAEKWNLKDAKVKTNF